MPIDEKLHPWRREWDENMGRWKAAFEALDEGIKKAARDLQQGAIDLHVHGDPSLVYRSVDLFEAAEEASQAGMRAIVVKDHHTGTQAQAWLAQKYARVAQPFEILGSLWLNNHAGGYNVYAVDSAINFGARMISCPTVSSEGDMARRQASGHGHTHPPDPSLLKVEYMDERPRPVEATDSDGHLKPDVIEVLDRIAEAGDVILGTGHLAGEELIQVVNAARERGVARINMTHAQSYSGLTPEEIKDLCHSTGAYAEYTTVQFLGHGIKVDDIAGLLRKVGIEHVTYGTDAGVSITPRPVEFHLHGIAFMLDSGLTEEEIVRVVSTNQRTLLGLD